MTTGRINQVTDRRSFRHGRRVPRAGNSPPCLPEPTVEPPTTVGTYPWGSLPDRSPNVNSPQTAGHRQRLLPRTQHTGEARTQAHLRRKPSISCEQCSHATDRKCHRPLLTGNQPVPSTGLSLRMEVPASVRSAPKGRLARMHYPNRQQERTCGGLTMRAGTIGAVFRTTSPGSQPSSCRSLSGENSPGQHHWNRHCLGTFTRQAPLERHCVPSNSPETSTVETTLHVSEHVPGRYRRNDTA